MVWCQWEDFVLSEGEASEKKTDFVWGEQEAIERYKSIYSRISTVIFLVFCHHIRVLIAIIIIIIVVVVVVVVVDHFQSLGFEHCHIHWTCIFCETCCCFKVHMFKVCLNYSVLYIISLDSIYSTVIHSVYQTFTHSESTLHSNFGKIHNSSQYVFFEMKCDCWLDWNGNLICDVCASSLLLLCRKCYNRCSHVSRNQTTVKSLYFSCDSICQFWTEMSADISEECALNVTSKKRIHTLW
jgi:hypothetical protein